MINLTNKHALVFGVTNERSIAWCVAKELFSAGANIILVCQNERIKREVEQLARTLSEKILVLVCDVSDDGQLDLLVNNLRSYTDRIDVLVHSIAYAPKEVLHNPFVQVSRDSFKVTMDVSVYSMIAVVQRVLSFMQNGGSVITMSYYGSQKAIPNYNLMGPAKAALEAVVRYLANELGPRGIRVNAISAGPVNTVASRAIPGFLKILKHYQSVSPLRRNVKPEEIGTLAAFLASDLSGAITGQVIFADCGYSIVGL